MKLTTLFGIICCSLIAMACNTKDILENETSDSLISNRTIDIPFSFNPIVTDSIWINTESAKARKKACQIPPLLLKEMTTEALVESVIHYPFAVDFLSFNTIQEGLNSIESDFNGFRELMKRPDATNELIRAFEYLDFDGIAADMKYDRANSSVTFIESGFLTSIIFSNKWLNSPILDYSRDLCLSRIKEISGRYNDIFGSFYMEIINELSQLQTKAAGDIMSYMTVYTHSGNPVTAYLREEMTEHVIREVTRGDILAYPGAEYVEDASFEYNGHSYAWYMSCGGSKCWISDPSPYHSDPYYTGSAIPYSPGYSYVDFYGYDFGSYEHVHSALLYSMSPLLFISKWFRGAVMIHSHSNCPYDDTVLTYYRTSIPDRAALICSSGNSEIAINQTSLYSSPYFHSSEFTFLWSITDAKGDDVIGSKATISFGNDDYEASISFNRAGLYDIVCDVFDTSSLVASYSFMAIVEI